MLFYDTVPVIHSGQMYKLAEDIKCTASSFIPSSLLLVAFTPTLTYNEINALTDTIPQNFTIPHVQFQLTLIIYW